MSGKLSVPMLLRECPYSIENNRAVATWLRVPYRFALANDEPAAAEEILKEIKRRESQIT